MLTGVLSSERASEPSARAVKPHPNGPRCEPQQFRDLTALKTVPRDQHQQLTVTVGQRLQSLEHSRVIASRVRPACRTPQLFVYQPALQRVGSRATSSTVREHAAGDRQQPRKGIGRDLIEPPPRSQEHLSHDVIRIPVACPTPSESPDQSGMF